MPGAVLLCNTTVVSRLIGREVPLEVECRVEVTKPNKQTGDPNLVRGTITEV